jgi:hypothetical protein
MKCGARKSASVRGRARAFTLTLAFLGFFPGTGALAQALYKWTDKDGRVQYADKPPAGFKGEVTRIEIDAVPTPVKPAAAPPSKAQPDDDAKEKVLDPAAKRRAERERLSARLAAAREKVEKARADLAGGEGILDEEKQIVQQHHARDAKRPQNTPAPRQNCMGETTSAGRTVWNCPTPIPGEAYFDRQKTLEEALQKAEEELAEAERAYRRGVD